MPRYFFFYFILFLSVEAYASENREIIKKLQSIHNFSFNFKQTIGDKDEKGSCVIQYPKKIYCEYQNINKKIIVSNGKTLVIKNRNNGTYYRYPLARTPLQYILDKQYLINKIITLESRNISDKYITFKMLEDNNEINIFFDAKTFNLIGWQTEDIYKNLSITFITSITFNEKINNNLFTLPEAN